MEQLLVSSRPKMLRFAKVLGLSIDDREDLVQTASLRALQADIRGSYDRSQDFFNWICRVMVNLLIDQKRAEARRLNALAIYLDSMIEDPRSLEASQDIECEVLLDQMAAAIGHEDAVTAFRRVQIDMISYDLLSQMTEIPVGTLRVRVHRGRKALASAEMRDALAA